MFLCMKRTTIVLDDDVMESLKIRSVQEGTSMKEMVNRHLRDVLSGKKKRSNYKFQWKTYKGKLQPGVSLEDRDTLFEIMEGRK
jgi:plasmid stability protein